MKAWKSILFLLVVMIHFQPYAVAGNNPSSTEKPVGKNQEIIEKINRLEKGITSFACNFEVQISAEDQATPKKEQGNISFKAPSFWRLEKYEPGSKEPFFAAGCNGKVLWKNDKEDMNPDVVAKADVENISDNQRNALMLQAAGISPFFLFSEMFLANITLAIDGQDNTWIIEMALDKPISPAIPFKVDKMKMEVSKETGLIKTSKLFSEGKQLASVTFENTKFDTTLTKQ